MPFRAFFFFDATSSLSIAQIASWLISSQLSSIVRLLIEHRPAWQLLSQSAQANELAEVSTQSLTAMLLVWGNISLAS